MDIVTAVAADVSRSSASKAPATEVAVLETEACYHRWMKFRASAATSPTSLAFTEGNLDATTALGEYDVGTIELLFEDGKKALLSEHGEKLVVALDDHEGVSSGGWFVGDVVKICTHSRSRCNSEVVGAKGVALVGYQLDLIRDDDDRLDAAVAVINSSLWPWVLDLVALRPGVPQLTMMMQTRRPWIRLLNVGGAVLPFLSDLSSAVDPASLFSQKIQLVLLHVRLLMALVSTVVMSIQENVTGCDAMTQYLAMQLAASPSLVASYYSPPPAEEDSPLALESAALLSFFAEVVFVPKHSVVGGQEAARLWHGAIDALGCSLHQTLKHHRRTTTPSPRMGKVLVEVSSLFLSWLQSSSSRRTPFTSSLLSAARKDLSSYTQQLDSFLMTPSWARLVAGVADSKSLLPDLNGPLQVLPEAMLDNVSKVRLSRLSNVFHVLYSAIGKALRCHFVERNALANAAAYKSLLSVVMPLLGNSNTISVADPLTSGTSSETRVSEIHSVGFLRSSIILLRLSSLVDCKWMKAFFGPQLNVLQNTMVAVVVEMSEAAAPFTFLAICFKPESFDAVDELKLQFFAGDEDSACALLQTCFESLSLSAAEDAPHYPRASLVFAVQRYPLDDPHDTLSTEVSATSKLGLLHHYVLCEEQRCVPTAEDEERGSRVTDQSMLQVTESSLVGVPVMASKKVAVASSEKESFRKATTAAKANLTSGLGGAMIPSAIIEAAECAHSSGLHTIEGVCGSGKSLAASLFSVSQAMSKQSSRDEWKQSAGSILTHVSQNVQSSVSRFRQIIDDNAALARRAPRTCVANLLKGFEELSNHRGQQREEYSRNRSVVAQRGITLLVENETSTTCCRSLCEKALGPAHEEQHATLTRVSSIGLERSLKAPLVAVLRQQLVALHQQWIILQRWDRQVSTSQVPCLVPWVACRILPSQVIRSMRELHGSVQECLAVSFGSQVQFAAELPMDESEEWRHAPLPPTTTVSSATRGLLDRLPPLTVAAERLPFNLLPVLEEHQQCFIRGLLQKIHNEICTVFAMISEFGAFVSGFAAQNFSLLTATSAEVVEALRLLKCGVGSRSSGAPFTIASVVLDDIEHLSSDVFGILAAPTLLFSTCAMERVVSAGLSVGSALRERVGLRIPKAAVAMPTSTSRLVDCYRFLNQEVAEGAASLLPKLSGRKTGTFCEVGGASVDMRWTSVQCWPYAAVVWHPTPGQMPQIQLPDERQELSIHKTPAEAGSHFVLCILKELLQFRCDGAQPLEVAVAIPSAATPVAEALLQLISTDCEAVTNRTIRVTCGDLIGIRGKVFDIVIVSLMDIAAEDVDEVWLWRCAVRSRIGFAVLHQSMLTSSSLQELQHHITSRFADEKAFPHLGGATVTVSKRRDPFDTLLVCCPDHKQSLKGVRYFYDERSCQSVLSSFGAQCKAICMRFYNGCGHPAHRCVRRCHAKVSDDDPELEFSPHYVCKYPCSKVLPCQHGCTGICGEPCRPCSFVSLEKLSCGQTLVAGFQTHIQYRVFHHFQKLQCGEEPSPCHETITVPCARCGSKKAGPCCESKSSESWPCEHCELVTTAVREEYNIISDEEAARLQADDEEGAVAALWPQDATDKLQKLLATNKKKCEVKERLAAMRMETSGVADNEAYREAEEQLRAHEAMQLELQAEWKAQIAVTRDVSKAVIEDAIEWQKKWRDEMHLLQRQLLQFLGA